MNTTEFLDLSIDERIYAADRAVCLWGRACGTQYVLLYQLDGFYLEVFYDKVLRLVVDIQAFDDMDRLDPYLQQMNIELP